MIAVNTTPFSLFLLRKLNTWYSINDGNWSDSNTWISNGLDKKSFASPQSGDNVYILHNVNIDVSATVNNLYVQSKLSSNVNGLTLSVLGDLQAAGAVDFTGNSTTLNLYGYNNFINSFTAGNSTVQYVRTGSQNVMPLTYNILTIVTIGTATLAGDTIVNGSVNVSGASTTLELSHFNFTVYGQTVLNQPSFLSKNSSTGYTLFAGLFNAMGGDKIRFQFTAGSTLEFQNGFSGNQSYTGTQFGSGTTLLFTTRDQTIDGKGTTVQIGNANIVVGSGVTLSTGNGGISTAGTVTGIDSTSTFSNAAKFYMGAPTSYPMSTSPGVYNYKVGTNTTIGYTWSGNYTLDHTSYDNLVTDGTGTKSLLGDTVIANSLTVNTGTFECGAYALTVGGATTIGQPATFSKTSATGLLLFTGALITAGGDAQRLSLTGNPDIECRGGLTTQQAFGSGIGTGTLKFTTNNQTVTCLGNISYFSCAVSIVGVITVTLSSTVNTSTGFEFGGIVNGTVSGSTLKSNAYIKYDQSQQPMQTGVLDCNSLNNIFEYGSSGNQDITAGTYKNLNLTTGGAKKLLGNVSVTGIYALSAPATLNNNGFTLTNP